MSSSHFCYQHREQQQQPSSHLSLQYFFCKGSWKATFLQQERKFALAFGQVCFCFRSFFLLFSQNYWQMKSGKKYSSSKSNQESSHSSLIDIIQICKKWNVNYALQTVCVQKFFLSSCIALRSSTSRSFASQLLKYSSRQKEFIGCNLFFLTRFRVQLLKN